MKGDARCTTAPEATSSRIAATPSASAHCSSERSRASRPLADRHRFRTSPLTSLVRRPMTATTVVDPSGLTSTRTVIRVGIGNDRAKTCIQRSPYGPTVVDHLPRVHAGLDDLQRHLAADWFLLLGGVHDGEPALADLLADHVVANPVAGPKLERRWLRRHR